MWESFLEGVVLSFGWKIFAMMSLGLLLGVLVGALPGFTTVMAMAILLPISFFLEPIIGIPFLIGVYKGGIYGGSIPAILISIPGTGASVATTFDGPALTKKGQGRKAMEMALFASVFGDLTSDILTLLLIGPIALIALKVGPPELTAIVLLSLIVISATGSGSMVKGLIMGVIGLLLAMVGQDPLGFMQRFTFDIFAFKAGIPLLPMLIGVFAIPEILVAVEKEAESYLSDKVDLSKLGERLKFAEWRRCFRTVLRSTGIGSVLGATPGVGQVVAAFVGYAAAVNASKHPETFGKGELEGIAAAEAANNAVNGPTLVPLLTLGIPGDNITALLLGAFIAQGLRPGPQLFAEHGPLVFGIIMAMIWANILFDRHLRLRRFLCVPFRSLRPDGPGGLRRLRLYLQETPLRRLADGDGLYPRTDPGIFLRTDLEYGQWRHAGLPLQRASGRRNTLLAGPGRLRLLLAPNAEAAAQAKGPAATFERGRRGPIAYSPERRAGVIPRRMDGGFFVRFRARPTAYTASAACL
jgi:putative tricarboxylic transport membrane protein